jgi:lysyl-tRNA synthetase class 2
MDNENQLIAVRKQKLANIKKLGINPYPPRCERTHMIKELWENQDKFVAEQKNVFVAGRLNAMRRQGKIGFANVSDESGRIQLFVKKDLLGEENYEIFKHLDLGDFIQVKGECYITERGEFSIKAENIKILSKNVKPLPTVKQKEVDGKIVRYDEFTDIELRYRKRYLDLLLNPNVKKTFELRAKIISEMRRYLDNNGFLEVETPILQPLYGGANARPFTTHHNTLSMPLYLRIATELYLKRLIIGGFEKVYEIGKNFRNEGMDKTHNPEFTALEVYQAYTDLNGMMDLTENIITSIAENVFQTTEIQFGEHTISFQKPWRRATMLELIKEDLDKIRTFCKEHHIEIDEKAGPGKLITELFDRFVESHLIQPTFVTDFPKEVSPLAKEREDNPKLTERFEIFINGNEYGNAFTELNDPMEQRIRLEEQSKLREMGDTEANVVDEDFLEAMEYGMPPTGGLGIGIDRLIMLFTGQTSIKEVILFPTMKPE